MLCVAYRNHATQDETKIGQDPDANLRVSVVIKLCYLNAI